MTNQNVIEIFLQGGRAKTTNLYTDGTELINYTTTIAKWNGTEEQTKELEINLNYYSRTTSKIQTQIIKSIARLKQKASGNVPLLVLTGTIERIDKASKILKGEI